MRTRMDQYERRWNPITRRWVYKHREVMEQVLGRPLTRDEHVHHVDSNRLNNEPSNLRILTRADHCREHNPARYRRAWSLDPCTQGDCGRRRYGRGLCKKHYEYLRRRGAFSLKGAASG